MKEGDGIRNDGRREEKRFGYLKFPRRGEGFFRSSTRRILPRFNVLMRCQPDLFVFMGGRLILWMDGWMERWFLGNFVPKLDARVVDFSFFSSSFF